MSFEWKRTKYIGKYSRESCYSEFDSKHRPKDRFNDHLKESLSVYHIKDIESESVVCQYPAIQKFTPEEYGEVCSSKSELVSNKKIHISRHWTNYN